MTCPGWTVPCCLRWSPSATITSRPTRNTQTMICAQSGTPRRGAGMDVSVMNSLFILLTLPIGEGLFLFLQFFFQPGNIRIWGGRLFGLRGGPRCGRLHPYVEATEKQDGAQKNGNCRYKIRCESIWRLCQNAHAVMFNKILLDLFFASAFCQHGSN